MSVALIEKFITDRRVYHRFGELNSGCCVNCDEQLRRDARCGECGTPYADRFKPCRDVRADNALRALHRLVGAQATKGEKT